MTSISPLSQRMDPRAQMDARISAAASAGAISTDDQAALSGALDNIDSSLAADGTKGGKPGDMKAKIDGLIDGQVDSGALSEDQAAELRDFFAQGPVGGPGGPQGAGGPPPGPPPSNDDDSDDASSTTTQISEAAARKLEAMSAFLQKLRDSAASGSSVYGSNAGTSSNGSSATGWVIDSKA
ncbi:hypothetical protein ACCC88_06415 [Sphingomonas sp. Sphisp140]|uniref:hypothetical protein n=1 Tax=unclassified Sphingomonas TaxID=196159 RepID=UPI0039B000B1